MRFILLALVFCLILAIAPSCEAQQLYSATGIRSDGTAPGSLSPYLHLTNLSGVTDSSEPQVAYHTLVRPQLELRQQALQNQREIAQMRAELSRLNGTGSYVPTFRSGSGLQSRFMNTAHYYPQHSR